MKNNYRLLMLTLMSFFMISFLIACSSDNNNSSDNQNADERGLEETTELNIEDGKIIPTVTLTTVIGEDPTVQFKNGESYADNTHTRWVEEELGVDIDVLWSSPMGDGSYFEKLKLEMISGDELPDVFVSTNNQTTDMFIESGLLLDVEEAFEKYASDTWKEAMSEIEPQGWYPYMQDGRKYGIPTINEDAGAHHLMWIRQDWLDNLGLEAPTNIEEFEKVMDAFANQDPDGNGNNDTIALELATDGGYTVSPIGDASWIFGMFGAVPEMWYPSEDGSLQYGSVRPEIKDALIKLKEWKEKGYISDEIALHDFSKVTENVASGKVGIIGGEAWLMTYPGALMLENNPTALFTPVLMPEGANGQGIAKRGNSYNGAILINKNISEEALQAFFHYQNRQYSAYESDDPFTFKGYQEGYDYVIEEEKAIMDEEEIPGGRVETMKYTLIGSPANYPSKLMELNVKRLNGEELTNQERAYMAGAGIIEDNNPEPDFLEIMTLQAKLLGSEQESLYVSEHFQGPVTETMSRRWEMLTQLETEIFTDIIYDRKPVDAFDDFVEQWYSSGGDDITNEVNEWYDSVK